MLICLVCLGDVMEKMVVVRVPLKKDSYDKLIEMTGCSGEDALRIAVMHYLNCDYEDGIKLDRVFSVHLFVSEEEAGKLIKYTGMPSAKAAVEKLVDEVCSKVKDGGRVVGSGRIPKYLWG